MATLRRLGALGSQLQDARKHLPVPVAAEPDGTWAAVHEDGRCITIETELICATIPKNNPTHWMTGIEKHSFVDKTTGFHEVGDGLMVIDWLMESGSDESWQGEFDRNGMNLVPAPGSDEGGGGRPGSGSEAQGTDRYLWHDASWVRDAEPNADGTTLAWGARMAHGTTSRKRAIEGPQLCHRMGPVQPTILRGPGYVAVQTEYTYDFAAPGRNAGSTWTQLIVFPRGERHFVLMDKIVSANDSDEMFLRNDTPGCIRHERGDTFSEMYLSYSGLEALTIPSSEFFEPFPPDLKFNYRRDTHSLPEHFIRAYRLRDPATGAAGPWLAGITLAPDVVYEAWASMRPGGIIVMIEEVHGRPTKVGDVFSAAHVVGFFDDTEGMHSIAAEHHGATVLTADNTGWRLW
jgi:hypothetical protein